MQEDSSEIFFAARTSDWDDVNQDLIFDETRVNVGNRFHDGHTFIANKSGLYFFSLSAGGTSFEQVILNIENIDQKTGNIRREGTTINGTDVIYRNTFAFLDQDQEVKVFSETPLASNPQDVLTSWGGFNVDYLFDDSVAFLVGRNDTFRPLGFPTKLNFTDVFIDLGDNFNLTAHRFQAPEPGIYYFSYSVGQLVPYDVRVGMWKEGPEWSSQSEVESGPQNNNAINMLSKSTMIDVAAGESVSLRAHRPFVQSDPDNFQIAFMGFKYSPSKARQVAWAVHALTSFSGSPGVGLDPVPFESIPVNIGDVYNTTTDVFNIPVSGYYFLEFNVGVFGLDRRKPCSAKIVKGGVPGDEGNFGEVLASVIQTVAPLSYHCVGRSLIAYLEAGDVVRIVADENTAIYIGLNKQTTFLGFLLLEA